ncbi:extracellular solute-binding protein [Paenibacillus sp. IB182496]|uniref:Extracellular solute-binding protein n=1 Tax=Paenibacillus sabuli TaxID=2772509 RepID=A0A927BYA0_9BACL|nr:extracellular solute-binding protein [Paenibacillus sabuli]MBD2848121.1 extracellular solute-binding protein [Paenibacillus sabuli]
MATWITEGRKAGLLLAALLAMAACSGPAAPEQAEPGEDQPVAEPAVLRAVTMGTEPAAGMAAFYDQLDALTLRDLGVRVRFDYMPWGDEKNQIGRAIVAKEYDLYVGGAWTAFSAYATKNAFVDLAPLLRHTPELVAHYRGQLDNVKIGGKLYGIPQLGKAGAGGEGVLYREDLREAWGLPEIRDLKTLEQYLYRAREVYATVPMINDKRFAENLWTMIAGGRYHTVAKYYAVAPIDDPYTVQSLYDTPEYEAVVRKAKQWYDDGIVDPDILAATANETGKTLRLMLEDRKPLEFNNHFGAVSSGYIGALKRAHPNYEYGWYDYVYHTYPEQLYLPQLSAGTSTMISVGSHSAHAETALRFIELAHTNQTYYDLLQFGVEGEHYERYDGLIAYDGIDSANQKPGWTGLYDAYMQPPERYPGEWQAIHDELVREAGPELAARNGASPYEGFAFNTANLTETMAQLEQVRAQYVQPLAAGVSADPETELQVVQQRLGSAGMQAYLSELQEQLNHYAANRPVAEASRLQP